VKGREALTTYLSARSGRDLPLNEVKIIVVGDGGSGKTSLVKRLVGEKFNPAESQTNGSTFEYGSQKTNRIVLSKRIFGISAAKNIMHPTHQFFLSKRSLYVIVLDGRKEEDAEYWLQLGGRF
jgi:internalin A